MRRVRAPRERRGRHIEDERSRLLSTELHLEAQVRELVDQTLRPRGRIAVLEVVFTEFVVGLGAGDDVIDDHEQRMGERHHCLLVPAPGGDAVVAGCQSRVFGVRSRLRCLDEDGPQPDVALAGAVAAHRRPLATRRRGFTGPLSPMRNEEQGVMDSARLSQGGFAASIPPNPRRWRRWLAISGFVLGVVPAVASWSFLL
ncbi:MAG TPA: hypothetical protein VGS80_25140, partial [Ktedonobacterales bacterium]|nr:hypothetical protein [Ktedonobacterales bacterium]